MSFELTPDEISRVETAEYLGIHLDPIGYIDLSTIVILTTMYAIEFIALSYQFYHRDYPPLRVKNVPVMISLYIGGVSWFLGDIFTGGLVHLSQSSVLRNCTFTIIWCRACIGAYYVTSIYALRMYSLYHVFYKEKAFHGKIFKICIGTAVATIILFGTISTLIPNKLTTHYEEILDMCYIDRNYIIAVLLVIWSIWIYVGVMTWRLRNVSFCFNEFLESCILLSLLLTISIMNTVCLLVVRIYPASLAWRTALVYTNHVCANIGYWVVMFEPTYNCMFNREDYLQYWISILKEEDMERQYEYTMDNVEETINLVHPVDQCPKYPYDCNQTEISLSDLSLNKDHSSNTDGLNSTSTTYLSTTNPDY